MAFVLNRKAKELEDEIEALTQEIETLQVRVEVQIKENKRLKLLYQSEVQELEWQLAQKDTLVKAQNKEIEELKFAIVQKNILIANYEPKLLEQTERAQRLDKLVIRLRKKIPRYNERGAGRKSKITDEVIVQVKRLKSENKSLAEIAAEITSSTGINYSKSTVKKIVDAYIKRCEN